MATLRMDAARRREIERRFAHADALVAIFKAQKVPVPFLEESIANAREWGEELYDASHGPGRDEAESGRRIQAELAEHHRSTEMFHATQRADTNFPYQSASQKRMAELLRDTGLNETKRDELLRGLCGHGGGEALLRPELLAGDNARQFTSAAIRKAQAKLERCDDLSACTASAVACVATSLTTILAGCHG